MKKIILMLCLTLHVSTYAETASPDMNLYGCAQNRIQSQLQKRFFTEIYNLIKPHINSLKESIGEFSDEIADEWLCTHAHQNDPAFVRFADFDELCSAEHAFTQQRLSYIQKNLNKLLGKVIPANKIPRIAICCSGGGHRAMLCTFGFLKGLKDTGLLDCSTYMAGLSGSTWAMAAWVASQKNLENYLTSLPDKLYQGLEGVKNPKLLYGLAKQLMTKVMHGQFISMIDIYGPTLANTLLTDAGMERLNITLSDSHAHVANGKLPLPIYTAVTPNIEPYEWIEFTPFEIGSSYQKTYVPTWAFGRKFKEGKATNFAQEQSLGYMMGIFGSAFEFDIEDAVRQTSQSIDKCINTLPYAVQPILRHIIDDLINSPLDDIRLAPSSLPNFTYKTETRNLKDDKTLTLIDAGMHFNLPFPPLMRSERHVDIILTYDASANITGCQTLRWAEEYMKLKGLKFPPIDYAKADKQVMSIFKDPKDPNCPIVVYFPCIKNKAYSTGFDPEDCIKNSYCNTMNFTYNAAQINELMGLSTYAVTQNGHALISLIQEVINRKA
jgi:phospholipase A2